MAILDSSFRFPLSWSFLPLSVERGKFKINKKMWNHEKDRATCSHTSNHACPNSMSVYFASEQIPIGDRSRYPWIRHSLDQLCMDWAGHGSSMWRWIRLFISLSRWQVKYYSICYIYRDPKEQSKWKQMLALLHQKHEFEIERKFDVPRIFFVTSHYQ